LPLPNSTTKLERGDFADAALLILCLVLASITGELFFPSRLLTIPRDFGVPCFLAVLIFVTAFASTHLRQGFHGVTVAALPGLLYALFSCIDAVSLSPSGRMRFTI